MNKISLAEQGGECFVIYDPEDFLEVLYERGVAFSDS